MIVFFVCGARNRRRSLCDIRLYPPARSARKRPKRAWGKVPVAPSPAGPGQAPALKRARAQRPAPAGPEGGAPPAIPVDDQRAPNATNGETVFVPSRNLVALAASA
jgi:hypothetical protein